VIYIYFLKLYSFSFFCVNIYLNKIFLLNMTNLRKRTGKAIVAAAVLLGCLTGCGGESRDKQTAVVTDQATGAQAEQNIQNAPATASVGNEQLQVGQKLFTTNCAACHTLGTDRIIGPGLAGVNQRRSEEWLIRWIRNSQKMIQEGDEQAVKLYEEYNKMVMPAYNYSDDEIRGILAYIEQNQKQ
jgi:mono/diheme cytochrome c family protein